MLEKCSPDALLSQAFLGYDLYSKDSVCTAGDVHHILLTCIQAVLCGAVNASVRSNLLCFTFCRTASSSRTSCAAFTKSGPPNVQHTLGGQIS